MIGSLYLPMYEMESSWGIYSMTERGIIFKIMFGTHIWHSSSVLQIMGHMSGIVLDIR